MKHLSKKHNLTITEQKLHSIIIEEVKRILEYAEPRKQVINGMRGYFPQIAINWCLVHYCTLINEDVNQCKNHWKVELRDNVLNCAFFTLKNNNSYKSRLKVVYEAEERQEALTNLQTISKLIINKFIKENIDFKNNKNFDTCLQDLINNKDEIIHLIANNDIEEIIDYINKI